MISHLNIAIFESSISAESKTEEISALANFLKQIPRDTDLVVLPELFTTGAIYTSKEQALDLAERNTGDTISILRNLASKHSVAIMGSFLASTASRLYNRLFFIEPNGDEFFYDKRHLFGIGGEKEVFCSGVEEFSPVVRFRGFNIKPIICYDLRFPEACRNRIPEEYDILVVVANWPKARVYPWTQLLIGRAIENAAYVCGTNRRGLDSKDVDYGCDSSAIIDFKGKPLELKKISECGFYGSISLEELNSFRKKFPVLDDITA